ncbi:MAG: dienelactone hydrolase family protein [Bacteriovoracaceae bacterium]
MKIFFMTMLIILGVSCTHKTQNKKPTYSPVISFEAEGKKFTSNVRLPHQFKDKIPLVVIVHEWWGRNAFMQEMSDKIIKEGYATLVVDLYGDNKTVETPTDAQAMATPFYQNPQMGIERLNQYINLAKQDPHIDQAKIFVIGFCFGGTQALNLARSGADIKGVVSFHGGLASSLPRHPIKAKILALNGLADPFVPTKERKAFEQEMKSVKANYKVVNYKNATHAFTNPHSTAVGKKYNIPIAYNKTAAEKSFKELLKFLNQK